MTTSRRIGSSLTNSSASTQTIKLLASVWGLVTSHEFEPFGSLPGIGLFLLTRNLGTWAQIEIVFLVLLIGISERVERIDRSKDPEEVVIDETVGMWATLLLLWDASFTVIFAGFVLFRTSGLFKAVSDQPFSNLSGWHRDCG